jgi:transcriptional regulator with XRE-family HTH domain
MATYDRKLGYRIRTARLNAGLKQTELAEAVHTNRVFISRWENGHVLPGAYSIYKLAKALKVSADYLVLGEEEA